jgi:hypothetical protein
MVLVTFLIFFCGMTPTAFSKSLTWKDSTFSINVPSGWKEVKDLYGIPVTILGPVQNQTRAVVQIIPTSIKAIDIKPENAKGFGEKYAEGRKIWLKAQNGVMIELLAGRFDTLKDGSHMLYAGVSYQMNKKAFIERTFYISCPKNIFHLKIVQNFELVKQLADSEDIVRSFQCKG